MEFKEFLTADLKGKHECFLWEKAAGTISSASCKRDEGQARNQWPWGNGFKTSSQSNRHQRGDRQLKQHPVNSRKTAPEAWILTRDPLRKKFLRPWAFGKHCWARKHSPTPQTGQGRGDLGKFATEKLETQIMLGEAACLPGDDTCQTLTL